MDILSRITNAEQKIRNHSILLAISELQDIARESRNWEAWHTLKSIKETYLRLRSVFLSGYPDPGRSDSISEIADSLFMIADAMKLRASINSNGAFFAAVRTASLRNTSTDSQNSLEELRETRAKYFENELRLAAAAEEENYPRQLLDRRYTSLSNIFSLVLGSYGDRKFMDETYDLLMNSGEDQFLSSQIFYALVLSLLSWFDIIKFRTLLSLVENAPEDSLLQLRSRVALVFAAGVWSDRLEDFSTDNKRARQLADNMSEQLKPVIKTIAGVIDTERAASKLKEEVIPEMMKLDPDMLKKMREGFDPDSDEPTFNPEWEEMLDKSGIAKKMEELAEMVGNGADLMMVTFSQLKNFPFFNKPDHWFLPFDSRHPDIHLREELLPVVDAMVNTNGIVGDSDLYSLALALEYMPESQRQMMMNQLNAQMDQLREQMKSQEIMQAPNAEVNEIIKTVRNIFRFFKLGHDIRGFVNPFEHQLDILRMPMLETLRNDYDFMEVMAEYFMNRGRYAEAQYLFNLLLADRGADPYIWQKLGFTLQRSGDLIGARDAYLKAELFGEASPWLVKKLAFVNRKLGNHKDAVNYYSQVLEDDKDNLSVLINLANEYVKLGKFQEALQPLAHAYYLDSENPHIAARYAWTRLNAGDAEKSRELYAKILNRESSLRDLINAGHVEQVLGNHTTALDLYRKAASLDAAEFEARYRADIDALVRLGVSREGAIILLDSALFTDND